MNATWEVVPGLSNPKFTSFRVVNPEHRECFLTHGAFRVVIGKPDRQKGKANCTFRCVPGLAQPDMWSLEAVNWHGYFIRVRADQRLYLDRNDGSQAFKEEATFDVVSPLSEAE
jgi:hypothetical protein